MSWAISIAKIDKLSKSRNKNKNRVGDLKFLLYDVFGNPYSHLNAYLNEIVIIRQSDSLTIKIFVRSLIDLALYGMQRRIHTSGSLGII